jgi:hypothetical protein
MKNYSEDRPDPTTNPPGIKEVKLKTETKNYKVCTMIEVEELDRMRSEILFLTSELEKEKHKND